MIGSPIEQKHCLLAKGWILLRKDLAKAIHEVHHHIAIGVGLRKRKVTLSLRANRSDYADARMDVFDWQSTRFLSG